MSDLTIAQPVPDAVRRAARRCAIINLALGGAILVFAWLGWTTGRPLYWQIAVALLTTVPIMVREVRRWLRLRAMQAAS